MIEFVNLVVSLTFGWHLFEEPLLVRVQKKFSDITSLKLRTSCIFKALVNSLLFEKAKY